MVSSEVLSLLDIVLLNKMKNNKYIRQLSLMKKLTQLKTILTSIQEVINLQLHCFLIS
jgi:hypothetical protein